MAMDLLVATGAILVAGTVGSVDVHAPPGPGAKGLAALPWTEVLLLADDGDVVRFRLPGDNGGAWVIGGVPPLEPGQPWEVELVEGSRGLTPRGLGAGLQPLFEPERYLLNNVQYRATQLPLTFVLEEPGSAELGLEGTEAVLQGSMDAWTEVGCSTFAFAYGGRVAEHGVFDNYVAWEEEDWTYDPAIAGLTATRFGPFEELEYTAIGADIVFNGVDFQWVDGPGNVYAIPASVGARSIVTHELGHVTGLGHEMHVLPATMFGGYFGGDWQGTLAGDDRRGLCEHYPSGQDECEVDADCDDVDASERICIAIEGVNVCEERRDRLGDFCSLYDINCGDTCVVTDTTTGAEGYCSFECETDLGCPAGWRCAEVELKVPLHDALVCAPDPDYEEPTPEGDDDDSAEGSADGCSGCDNGSSSPLLCLIPAAIVRWRRRERRPGAGARTCSNERSKSL